MSIIERMFDNFKLEFPTNGVLNFCLLDRGRHN
nr:MAG TPA: hypothetical protein [Caudoviricetes sp.]